MEAIDANAEVHGQTGLSEPEAVSHAVTLAIGQVQRLGSFGDDILRATTHETDGGTSRIYRRDVSMNIGGGWRAGHVPNRKATSCAYAVRAVSDDWMRTVEMASLSSLPSRAATSPGLMMGS